MAQLTIKINGKYHLNVIQAYLLTPSHTDEIVDIVCNKTDNLVTNNKAQQNNIIMVTSTLRLARVTNQSPVLVLMGLVHTTSEVTLSSTLPKDTSWTLWTCSSRRDPTRAGHGYLPTVPQKNKLDFILSDKPHIFTDISVINSFNTRSDHCIIWGSLTINTKLERTRLIKWPKKPNTEV